MPIVLDILSLGPPRTMESSKLATLEGSLLAQTSVVKELPRDQSERHQRRNVVHNSQATGQWAMDIAQEPGIARTYF